VAKIIHLVFYVARVSFTETTRQWSPLPTLLRNVVHLTVTGWFVVYGENCIEPLRAFSQFVPRPTLIEWQPDARRTVPHMGRI